MITTDASARDADRAALIRQLHEAARRERARTVRRLLRKLIRRRPGAATWQATAHAAAAPCR